MDARDLDDFFGSDPVAGEAALARLAEQGGAALATLVPPDIRSERLSRQSEVRLTRLCATIGAEAARPVVIDRLAHGEWWAKKAVIPGFAALGGDTKTAAALNDLLKTGDIDVQRAAMEALGYMGRDVAAYTVRDIARYCELGSRSDRPDPYCLGKLWSYAIKSIAQMFARTGEVRCLRVLDEFLDDLAGIPEAYQPLGQAERAQGELVATAADGLQTWLNHARPDRRFFAVRGLGRLRLRRSAGWLAAVASSDFDPDVCVAAGFALSDVFSREAAEATAALVGAGTDNGAVAAAFSLLAAFDVDWPETVPLYERASTPRLVGRLRYAMALRRHPGWRHAAREGLSDADAKARGINALALARALGEAALPDLEGREREASTGFERSMILAAQIHAGKAGLNDKLHQALIGFGDFWEVEPCWLAEILSALVTADGDRRRADFWAEIAWFDLDRGLADLKGFGAFRDPAPVAAASAPQPAPPAAGAPPAAKIFVSYSHKDRIWLDRLTTVLAPLTRNGALEVWADTRLEAGDLWRAEIERAMAEADLALFLVSPHFLASGFVHRHELPPLLEAARAGETRIFWVAVDHALYEESPLAQFQCANEPARPLTALKGAARSDAIARIGRIVRKALGASGGG